MSASTSLRTDGGQVELPDGRTVAFEIRRSARSACVRLNVSARSGLVVIVPVGVPPGKVGRLVATRARWIAEKLKTLEDRRALLGRTGTGRPRAFVLQALGESWQVEYQANAQRSVGARTDREGRVIVYGAIDDTGACRAALRRWLARRARATLLPWLDGVAHETGLTYTDATVKNQRTRWGSCSARHRISLNLKLLFLPRELVRYVLVHELCHTLVRSHSDCFWMVVRQYAPDVELLHGHIREGWKRVPPWVSTDASRRW